MERLRVHESNGQIVAESSDGQLYLNVTDGSPFGRRDNGTFVFADGRVGHLGGQVVYIKDEQQNDHAAYWYEVDAPQEVVKRWLAGQSVGGRPVLAVTVTRASDAEDRPAWFFELTLPNPAPGEATWSAADLESLQNGARERAFEVGLDWPWFLRFRPESDEIPEEPADSFEQDTPDAT